MWPRCNFTLHPTTTCKSVDSVGAADSVALVLEVVPDLMVVP